MKNRGVLLVCVFLLAGMGCGRKDTTAIQIGVIKVTSEEFEQAFRMSAFAPEKEAGRKKFLDRFIAGKLVLDEAERIGLDKDPQFLQSIQIFWEQSLLKQMIARKTRELFPAVKVDDKEVRDYYEKHKEQFPGKELPEVYEQIKWFLFKGMQNKAIDEWVSSLRENAKVRINYDLLKISK